MNKKDILLLLINILFITAAALLSIYYVLNNVNECTRDPIKYGVVQIKDNYEVESVSGTIYLRNNGAYTSWDFGDEEFSISEDTINISFD
jgi:hypothetical protein